MAKLTLDDVEYETDDFTEEQNTILQVGKLKATLETETPEESE
jgi:hypothetical protein